ncbi:MAG: anhydro-N-acetylmuramic acid kinase [Xanthomonadales bacterium]|nr:anhydro-N-acetylmuramic acid kinase [Xanthomonadales bacterium]NIX12351.1 anhydro-N-acetylmuramic acid kinase [Xanthomonadales bacterium]
MSELFIGLMSGTSADAVDAVLVDFGAPRLRLRGALNHPIPPDLRAELLDLNRPDRPQELERLGRLDVAMGRLFAESATALLSHCGVERDRVAAIGSHGQTIRHCPAGEAPYTLQIGDPNVIAEHTGITTVGDFRRRDVAAGGQGAPLVAAFHEVVLAADRETRVVVNIGGMANLTILPGERMRPTRGFDSGPGNVLLDHWAGRHQGRPFDERGGWARAGAVHPDLLKALLADPFFSSSPPKSTGRERFNGEWLDRVAARFHAVAVDVQATLSELTAVSIAAAVCEHAPDAARVLVCGGGIHNADLMARLERHLAPMPVESTSPHGVDPDWIEAMAFAWLARRRLDGLPGNVPSVTGARHPVVLGGLFHGR